MDQFHDDVWEVRLLPHQLAPEFNQAWSYCVFTQVVVTTLSTPPCALFGINSLAVHRFWLSINFLEEFFFQKTAVSPS
jgi:hypothetical protein